MNLLGIFFLDHRSHYIQSLGDALAQWGHRLYVQTSWNFKEIEAGIRYFRPDILVTVGCDLPLTNPELSVIPTWCEKYRLFHIYWATEDKIHFEKWSLPFVARIRPHLVWTIHPDCVSRYEANGFPAEYFNFAFNPRWFPEKVVWGSEAFDVALIATTHLHARTFRYDSFAQLLVPLVRAGTRVKIWGFGWREDKEKFRREFGVDIPEECLMGYLPYGKTSEVYRQSKIVLGVQNAKDQVTQRTFEILGTGAFMIASRTEALEQLFVDGEEIVLIQSPEETVEKISYYLNRPEEREKIGKRARRKILQNHTFFQRFQSLHWQERILKYREERTE